MTSCYLYYHNNSRFIFKADIIITWILVYMILGNALTMPAIPAGIIAVISGIVMYTLINVRYVGYVLGALFSAILTFTLMYVLPMNRLSFAANIVITLLVFAFLYNKHGGFNCILHKLFPDNTKYMNDPQYQRWHITMYCLKNGIPNPYDKYDEEQAARKIAMKEYKKAARKQARAERKQVRIARAEARKARKESNELTDALADNVATMSAADFIQSLPPYEESVSNDRLVSIAEAAAIFGIDNLSMEKAYNEYKDKLLVELAGRLDVDTAAEIQYLEFDNYEDAAKALGELPQSCYIASIMDKENNLHEGDGRHWTICYEVLTFHMDHEKTQFICLAKLYEDYKDVNEAADKVMELKNCEAGDMCINKVYDYQAVKGRIIASFPTPDDELHLSENVCNTVWGLPVIYTIIEPGSDRKGGCYVPVTKKLAAIWGISVDELHISAVDNLTHVFRWGGPNGYWGLQHDIELGLKYTNKVLHMKNANEYPTLYHFDLNMKGETKSYSNGHILSAEIMDLKKSLEMCESTDEIYVIISRNSTEGYNRDENDRSCGYTHIKCDTLCYPEKEALLLKMLSKSLEVYSDEYTLVSNHIYNYSFIDHTLTLVE